MTKQDAADLLRLMARFWPSFRRDDNPELTADAWAALLYDVPFEDARAAAIRLARSDRKFYPAPEPRHILEETRSQVRRDTWDRIWAQSCHDCLGWDVPLYRQMQIKAREQKRIEGQA